MNCIVERDDFAMCIQYGLMEINIDGTECILEPGFDKKSVLYILQVHTSKLLANV